MNRPDAPFAAIEHVGSAGGGGGTGSTQDGIGSGGAGGGGGFGAGGHGRPDGGGMIVGSAPTVDSRQAESKAEATRPTSFAIPRRKTMIGMAGRSKTTESRPAGINCHQVVPLAMTARAGTSWCSW